MLPYANIMIARWSCFCLLSIKFNNTFFTFYTEFIRVIWVCINWHKMIGINRFHIFQVANFLQDIAIANTPVKCSLCGFRNFLHSQWCCTRSKKTEQALLGAFMIMAALAVSSSMATQEASGLLQKVNSSAPHSDRGLQWYGWRVSWDVKNFGNYAFMFIIILKWISKVLCCIHLLHPRLRH